MVLVNYESDGQRRRVLIKPKTRMKTSIITHAFKERSRKKSSLLPNRNIHSLSRPLLTIESLRA